MTNACSEFHNAIRATHLEPPEVIEPGRMYRFPGVGKSNGNTAGWCRLFEDGQGGCFGDWSSGFTQNWQANRDSPLTPSELTVFKKHITETRALATEQRQEKVAQAAEKAAAIWNTAGAAKPDHPYLFSKHIEACGVRQHQGALVVPVRSDGKLCSLQFISPDGSKRFLSGGQVSGGYCSIGATKGANALCIAEGFATGATIHQATGYPVAVAFHAGNLESVTQAMRKCFPDLSLIVCADDDAATEGNPGITKASHAANAIGAKLARPTFSDQRPEGATDFNDMSALTGLESVAESIKAAVAVAHEREKNSHPWPEPLPLSVKIDPELYPLDALPNTLRKAVEEVLAFTKAPVALVASSGLAALSLAVQAHADVKRAEKLSGPVGLFLLTLADSGERKSTCDGFFMQAIREYEANQAEEAKPLVKDYKAAMDSWEAKRGGIKDKIRLLAKAGKSSQEQDAELRDLEYDKPESTRVPRLIYGDATPEALKWNLAKGWPSGGVVSSEAGLVFGAHGMGKESVMRNLATLNQLWDGADIATERRTSESFTVRGVRVSWRAFLWPGRNPRKAIGLLPIPRKAGPHWRSSTSA